jgi:hypothetical protein
MRYTYILIAAILLSACGGGQKDNKQATDRLDKLKWLNGNWQGGEGDDIFHEGWKQEADKSWTGLGVLLHTDHQRDWPKTDTAFREDLRIVAEDGVVWYIPAIKGQGDKKMRFREKEITDHSFLFENEADSNLAGMPRFIGYEKTSDSTIHAWIEGKERKEEFYFMRAR